MNLEIYFNNTINTKLIITHENCTNTLKESEYSGFISFI